MRKAREAWFEAQPDLDPARLVFIDETWTTTNMARTRGRCAKGQRLRSPVPHGHRKTTTFVAGLRLSGMVAPFVLDGPINRDAFQAYIDQVLVPDLSPGDIVVMDNLQSHKGPAVRAAIEAVGAQRLYLPAYSPEPKDRAATSIRSRWRLPSSRRCYARQPSAPLRAYGPPSDASSRPSNPTNAKTTSPLQDMSRIKKKSL